MMKTFFQHFCENGLKKANQKDFRVEKVIKKGDNLYIKVYDNSFNS